MTTEPVQHTRFTLVELWGMGRGLGGPWEAAGQGSRPIKVYESTLLRFSILFL